MCKSKLYKNTCHFGNGNNHKQYSPILTLQYGVFDQGYLLKLKIPHAKHELKY